MEKERERDKQVSVSPALFTDFERMAQSYGLTNKALLETMIRYFQATKADPRDPKTDNPTDAIKALDKRLISFIRKQEKERLNPISDDLKLLIQLVAQDLPKTLRQSQIRTIGGAIKSDLLNEKFLTVYQDMINKTT